VLLFHMEESLFGKTYVVTGATSGIGLASSEALAKRGANVIGVGRSPERCHQAEECLRTISPHSEVAFCVADLSLQTQVHSLAEAIRVQLAGWQVQGLEGLLNNAGVFTFYRTLTREGFEMQWAVNHLAPFLLTNELLPLLQVTSMARVVTVSSGSHYRTRLRWHDIQLRRGYNPLLAYKQTKLCNVLFTYELRRRLGKGSSVQAFAADPGLVNTSIGIKGNPALARWVWGRHRRRGITAEESARGVVYLLTDLSIQERQEVYWKHGQPKPPDPIALDETTARRLWDLSARMCGSRSDAGLL
jgi:NAD(P)-dependent dehydrogenase (short-subunit alcohol dehydrogenase family)